MVYVIISNYSSPSLLDLHANINFYEGGHCKNLVPHYEKAGKNLKGIATVAAVDCDAEQNKAFCSSQGVQGFPTLKIFKPSSKKGKPIIEGKCGL